MFDNSYEKLHKDIAAAASQCFYTHTDILEDGTNEYVYTNEDRNAADAVLIDLIKEAIKVTEQKRVGIHKSTYEDMIKWNNQNDNPKYNESKHSYLNLWNRYSGQVPIFARKSLSKRFDHKVNNKINNDFFSEIVDDKVSFTMGKPPTYIVTEGDDQIKEELNKFIEYNNMGALDRDTFLISSISGVSYRAYMASTDDKGETQLEVLPIVPWNVIFFQEKEYAPTIAIILGEDGDDRLASVFINYGVLYTNISAGTVIANRSLIKMPIVEYPNNGLKISDCDKVLELIDAYDRLISDTSNELEQMRLAYLAISGGQRLTKEEAKEFKSQLQEAGVLHLPDGVTANFLIKTVDMTSVLNFLTVIENNIYRFSKSINYSNSKFTGGQLTGIALKQATINLRNKCLTSWLSFDDANWYQWEILGEFIATKYAMETTPEFKIEGYIKLNIPTDNQEIANTMASFKGNLSTKTILRLAELDLDIDSEYEEMKREGLIETNED